MPEVEKTDLSEFLYIRTVYDFLCKYCGFSADDEMKWAQSHVGNVFNKLVEWAQIQYRPEIATTQIGFEELTLLIIQTSGEIICLTDSDINGVATLADTEDPELETPFGKATSTKSAGQSARVDYYQLLKDNRYQHGALCSSQAINGFVGSFGFNEPIEELPQNPNDREERLVKFLSEMSQL